MGIKKTLVSIVLGVTLALGLSGKVKAEDYPDFPRKFETPVLVPSPNNPSEIHAVGTYITKDGKNMLLTIWPSSGNPRICVSSWGEKSSSWNNPQALIFPSGSAFATLDPYETKMYYTGNGRISVVTYTHGVVVGMPVLNIGKGCFPFFDGKRLFFSDYNPPPNWDIFYSGIKDDGTFNEPRPLDEINTKFDECMGYVTPDGKTMLFFSNRPEGHGGNDIYKATWDEKTGKWKNIRNLGQVINTSEDEGHVFYCPSTRTLYFNRGINNRMQAKGSERIKKPEPEKITGPVAILIDKK